MSRAEEHELRAAVTVQLPAALAEAWHNRCASLDWNPDRVIGAALLYFMENAKPRAEMFKRLMDVEAGDVIRISDDDVLEGHVDACFEVIQGELDDNWYAPQGDPEPWTG